LSGHAAWTSTKSELSRPRNRVLAERERRDCSRSETGKCHDCAHDSRHRRPDSRHCSKIPRTYTRNRIANAWALPDDPQQCTSTCRHDEPDQHKHGPAFHLTTIPATPATAAATPGVLARAATWLTAWNRCGRALPGQHRSRRLVRRLPPGLLRLCVDGAGPAPEGRLNTRRSPPAPTPIPAADLRAGDLLIQPGPRPRRSRGDLRTTGRRHHEQLHRVRTVRRRRHPITARSPTRTSPDTDEPLPTAAGIRTTPPHPRGLRASARVRIGAQTPGAGRHQRGSSPTITRSGAVVVVHGLRPRRSRGSRLASALVIAGETQGHTPLPSLEAPTDGRAAITSGPGRRAAMSRTPEHGHPETTGAPAVGRQCAAARSGRRDRCPAVYRSCTRPASAVFGRRLAYGFPLLGRPAHRRQHPGVRGRRRHTASAARLAVDRHAGIARPCC